MVAVSRPSPTCTDAPVARDMRGNGLGHAAFDQRGVHPDLVEDGRHDAAFLLEQRLEQMLGLNGRLIILLGQALRLRKRRLGFLCQFF